MSAAAAAAEDGRPLDAMTEAKRHVAAAAESRATGSRGRKEPDAAAQAFLVVVVPGTV